MTGELIPFDSEEEMLRYVTCKQTADWRTELQQRYRAISDSMRIYLPPFWDEPHNGCIS